MANIVDYGLEFVKLLPANADGSLPDFDTATGVHTINLIVMDSFQEDKDDDQTTDISVEELDDPILRLNGEKGLKNMTLQSYDLSPEQYAYLFGYTTDAQGRLVENPTFVLPAQALYYKTRPIDNYPSNEHWYAKANVKVKKSGTTGKNGLPNITFDITFPANMDPDGNPLPNHYAKYN